MIENWNGANSFIFYGRSSEFATNRLDEQELAALSLHLLQICLVYILSRDFVSRSDCNRRDGASYLHRHCVTVGIATTVEEPMGTAKVE